MKIASIIGAVLLLAAVTSQASNLIWSDFSTPESCVHKTVDLWNSPESISATTATPVATTGTTSSSFSADFAATVNDIINGPWGFMGGYGHSLSGTGQSVAFGLLTYNFTSNTNGGGFNSGAIVGYDKLWGGHQDVTEINSFSGGWQISYSGNLASFDLTNVTWIVTGFQLIATPQGNNAVGAITGVAFALDVYSFHNFDIMPTFIYESRNGQTHFDGNYGLVALAVTHGW
jgi:hypothetical protein